MMTHVEGPIVDSFYDMALLSWHENLDPPLPLLAAPHQQGGSYQFGLDNAYASEHWLEGKKGEAIAKERRQKQVPTDLKGAELGGPGEGKVFIGGKYESVTDHISMSLLSLHSSSLIPSRRRREPRHPRDLQAVLLRH